MADIVQFADRKRNAHLDSYQIIEKVIDGKIVEYVNFDTLTPIQRSQLLGDHEDLTAGTK